MVALAVVLLMTPAAYHRIVYAGEDSQDMHRVGSALVTAATAKPLDAPVTSMILLIMDFLVVWAPIRREGAAVLRSVGIGHSGAPE